MHLSLWLLTATSSLVKPSLITCKLKLLFFYVKSYKFDRITANWDEKNGWAAPEIRPYENLSLAPSAVVFHYASEVIQRIKKLSDRLLTDFISVSKV